MIVIAHMKKKRIKNKKISSLVGEFLDGLLD
jgi:hypothetical protein